MKIRQAIIHALAIDPRSRTEQIKAARVGRKTYYKFIQGDNVNLETVEKLAALVKLSIRPATECDECEWEHKRAEIRGIAKNPLH